MGTRQGFSRPCGGALMGVDEGGAAGASIFSVADVPVHFLGNLWKNRGLRTAAVDTPPQPRCDVENPVIIVLTPVTVTLKACAAWTSAP